MVGRCTAVCCLVGWCTAVYCMVGRCTVWLGNVLFGRAV